MSVPDLTPVSQSNKVILPASGNAENVNSEEYPLPFGIYTDDFWSEYQVNAYKQGSADQVTYVYKKLGGDVLDLEITEAQVYAAYEEACLEYSYIINIHQGKNVLSNILGASTGSFDSDGQLLSSDDTGNTNDVQPGTHVQLAYPRFDFAYARRVSDGVSEEIGVGGSLTVYSASFDLVNGTQDYDLQTIIRNSDEFGDDADADDFIRSIGKSKIQIKKVYWRTPQAMWHFYGLHGGTSSVGNYVDYANFSNASMFHAVPTWQSKLEALAFEDKLYNRHSHHSFELKNNKLRIFPIPRGVNPSKMWVEFSIGMDNWVEEPTQEGEAERDIGLMGINNLNSAPFPNIPYDKINSIGKQWIRRFALSLSKEMLGMVRSKFGSIPIPGNDIQLNGADLISAAKEEQTALRDELKEVLDELTYGKMIEGDAALLESASSVQAHIPLPIFVG